MNTTLKVAGIAGSLRAGSFSHMIMNTLAEQLPAGGSLHNIDIGALPHYNEDLECHALPESVVNARATVNKSNAVFIVTPEFNHGMPGVLKNTLDWLSRPAFNSPMLHKYVFFMTHSPGALGGVRAQYQLRETLASMHCNFVPMGEIAIPHIGEKVQDNRLTDPRSVEFIRQRMARFIEQAQAASAQLNQAWG